MALVDKSLIVISLYCYIWMLCNAFLHSYALPILLTFQTEAHPKSGLAGWYLLFAPSCQM